MKKDLSLIVAFAFSASLFSQITITTSDMPSPDDSVRVSYAATTGSVDHTQSGPNYLWDFSSLTPYAQEELRYTQPAAIPFNFIATVSHVNPSPDSIAFIGNVPSDLTDHFKNGSSGYREVGFSFSYAPLGSFSIPVIYANADYLYRFPLNYTDADTSDADWTLNAQNFGLFYIGETIHRTSNVDGWGTLITPFDTFQCIRVVSIVTTVDTIGTDSLTGYSIARPIKGEYKWLANGMKIPVLEVETQLINNAEIVTNVVYQDSLRNNVFQVGIPEFDAVSGLVVYPNPSSGDIHLEYEVASHSDVTIELIDCMGRMLEYNELKNVESGKHSFAMNVENFNPGTYFVEVTAGDLRQVRKVVIIR